MYLQYNLTCFFAMAAVAQQFIPSPSGMSSLSSQHYPGASIDFKETRFCETTPGVNSYSGYVTLPSSLLYGTSQNQFNVSLFFWYFEARSNPSNAPTSIYIGGGPGVSGLDGASGFPCNINQDSNSTTLNNLSWNTKVNMLYIDQPIGVGFSYVSLVKGTTNLLNSQFTPLPDQDVDTVPTNLTNLAATMSTPVTSTLVNTTQQVARTMWQFAQVWFQEFPGYNTSNPEISLWSVSYGGTYGPGILSFFQSQNAQIANGSLTDKNAKNLRIGTLGIQNGCIDVLLQGPGYPQMAFNNTYGLQVYSREVFDMAMGNFSMPGGCAEQIVRCRAAASASDPLGLGNDSTVNKVCAGATQFCWGVVQGAYTASSNRSAYDIAHFLPVVIPDEYSLAFFNQRWVQEALGVPLNFTIANPDVVDIFFGVTGDPMRASVANLEHLLDEGVKIAFVYGDRDYRCNWIGAENVSLSMNYNHAASFRAAGYTPIVTNASYQGGLVRQHGNVSFSRVFDAGHSVAAYQPETVHQIFERAMFARDIATGTTVTSIEYASSGLKDSFQITTPLSTSPESVCYLYDVETTCTTNQVSALAAGEALVKDFVVTVPRPVV